MAGNLMSTPTAFTSFAIGSGHSAGGSDYSGGSEVLGIHTGTFTTSNMTAAGGGGMDTATFTVGKGLATTDWITVHPLSVNTAAFDYQARISAAGVATLVAINSTNTSAVQGALAFRWLGMKVAP
jgi:hypothetical protein